MVDGPRRPFFSTLFHAALRRERGGSPALTRIRIRPDSVRARIPEARPICRYSRSRAGTCGSAPFARVYAHECGEDLCRIWRHDHPLPDQLIDLRVRIASLFEYLPAVFAFARRVMTDSETVIAHMQ